MPSIGDRLLKIPGALDEGLVPLPFSFITQGASAPITPKGAIIQSNAGVSSLVRTSAGLFSFNVVAAAFEVVGGDVTCTSGATEDILPHLDATLVTTTGVVTVRTMTGAVATDPISGCTIYGVLWVRITDRHMTA